MLAGHAVSPEGRGCATGQANQRTRSTRCILATCFRLDNSPLGTGSFGPAITHHDDNHHHDHQHNHLTGLEPATAATAAAARPSIMSSHALSSGRRRDEIAKGHGPTRSRLMDGWDVGRPRDRKGPNGSLPSSTVVGPPR
ncbi:hypothetical protein MAPG_05206 [Magnaporthiopsis poae ATCC 64411]|uniref:Uncharacterized protein n=1 Tax=Magnaporthiopsis poae (strain ATCC 64411 / 73-15) TaxID=644358 RepID=A0A0C4DYS7_MAGP6|nr:hypothetical protein MAPG_05206 [Magnaporthiopsis poae ATCC 64411]